jgi:hypothetical protein
MVSCKAIIFDKIGRKFTNFACQKKTFRFYLGMKNIFFSNKRYQTLRSHKSMNIQYNVQNKMIIHRSHLSHNHDIFHYC